jgi:hypothetical protein
MILAYKWLKMASYDGRDLNLHIPMKTMSVGYHMYMTPEDAARGIIIIDTVPDINPDTGNSKTYVDVEK